MEARLRSLKLTAFNPPLPRKPPGLRLCEPRGHRRGRLLMLLVCFRRCGRVRKKHHCEADEDPTRQRLQRWVSALPFFAKPESDTVSCFIVRVIWTDPRSRGYGASGLRSGTAAPAGPPASKLTPLFCSPRAPIRQTGVAVVGDGRGGGVLVSHRRGTFQFPVWGSNSCGRGLSMWSAFAARPCREKPVWNGPTTWQSEDHARASGLAPNSGVGVGGGCLPQTAYLRAVNVKVLDPGEHLESRPHAWFCGFAGGAVPALKAHKSHTATK